MQRAGDRFVPLLWGVRRCCRQSGSWWCRAVDTARHHGRSQVLSCVGRRASSSPGQGPHHGGGHPVLCVSWGLTARATKLRSRRGWRRAAALIRSVSSLVTARRAMRCQCAGGIGCVAGSSGGLGGHGWRGVSYLAPGVGAFVFQLFCQARTTTQPSLPERGVPGHRIDVVAVPRDWFSGMEWAEVETAVALPGSGAFDHAVPFVEVVISPSKASHECSRSVDASRAALRRREVREQIEVFWSQAPPIPSELSVDEHAELLAKAPPVQAAPQADWMDEEAWQALTLWQEGHTKRPVGSPPRMVQDVLRAVKAGGEARQ